MSCRMKENILQVQIYFNKRKDKLFLLKREKKKNIKGIDWQKDDKCIFYFFGHYQAMSTSFDNKICRVIVSSFI
jgi:hypothetical protein